ncbi:HDOD domain-containing protein [Ectothiorhodospiraceae bacterium WFHF3C12]|nr:HDOD domain-containing protein [Ectothiorhodospiraceae bacterium WFHF3C12]
MALPSQIEAFLKRAGQPYSLITHPATRRIQRAAVVAGVDPGRVARAVLLRHGSEYWLCILPADRLIQFGELNTLLGGPADVVPPLEAARLFTDCAERTTPALAPAYGLPAVIDESLADLDMVYVAAGRHNQLLKLEGVAFRTLYDQARWGGFSRPLNAPRPAPAAAEQGGEYAADSASGDTLERLYALPPMPQMAFEVLRLREDPDASVTDLCELVEQDPSLAAQVVRYARAPFFGYRGSIDSVHDAIHRVLGFDMVVNMTVGLATGRMFRNPVNGPLGLDAFWRHATYSAALVQELARRMPPRKRPRLGLAYLSALLHNFGFLLLGHLFRPEFEMLNRLVAVNPATPVVAMERQVLGLGEARQVIGMGHARLGAWLMKRWEMPEELVTALAEHHNEDYDGAHASYVGLVLLADRLLRRIDLGDGDGQQLPVQVLERLGLYEEVVDEVFNSVLAGREGLDAMAQQLAA